jgi:hypothetical protein
MNSEDWDRVQRYGQDIEVSTSSGEKVAEGKGIVHADGAATIFKADGSSHLYSPRDFTVTSK